jgi:hypothetical protein
MQMQFAVYGATSCNARPDAPPSVRIRARSNPLVAHIPSPRFYYTKQNPESLGAVSKHLPQALLSSFTPDLTAGQACTEQHPATPSRRP